ncbi:hypothetical protein HMPREF3151_08970 [Corynebacterium sp. HMSC05H05]|nr:hypothetical protein HMPREF3151_08970 [Corynebacterium sp. HMSC05H05]
MGILGGGVWALVRPAYIGVVEGGGLRVDQAESPVNAEFAGFGSFALLTVLAGVVVAVVALISANRGRVRGSVAWLLWAGTVSAVAAVALYIFGGWFVGVVHPLPSPDELADGDTLTMVPPVRPGAAWAAGPFAAVLVYWTANLLACTGQDE